MAHRYFTKDINDKFAILHGDEARHVSKVLRMKKDDKIIICDENGTDYHCELREFNDDNVIAEIISSEKCVSEPSVLVTMYVGYPKSDKLELIIQKCVELGAVKIVPFFSKFCVVTPKNEEKKNIRYNKIAFESAKQCGRGIIPTVEMPLTYKEMLKDASENDCALFCYEAGGKSLHSRLTNVESVAIITGAEGGFSPDEAQTAKDIGISHIGLGPRILRCETAPIAALSAVMALSGNLQ